MQYPIIHDAYDFPELSQVKRSAIVDSIIRVGAYAGAVAAACVAPNIVQAIDKPLAALDKSLDERKRRRMIMETVYYMKSRGYLVGDYEHGLQLTDKSRKRLRAMQIRQLQVVVPHRWDGLWRVIFYDVPEKQRSSRQLLSSTLRSVGCYQIQKSVWVTPFDCREVVEGIAMEGKIDQFVTYIEATYLANAGPLLKRFIKKYPAVSFDLTD